MQLDTSGVVVRIVLRIIFTILFIYLGLLGGLCNKFAQKRLLLKNQRIRICETGGYLGLGDLLDGYWNLKHIPNVKWGVLMAAIGVLAKLADLATAAVQDTYLNSLCDFDTGMVLSLSGQNSWYHPPFNGRP